MASRLFPHLELCALFDLPLHAEHAMIKAAYHRLILQLHPDKCGNTPKSHANFIGVLFPHLSLPSGR